MTAASWIPAESSLAKSEPPRSVHAASLSPSPSAPRPKTTRRSQSRPAGAGMSIMWPGRPLKPVALAIFFRSSPVRAQIAPPRGPKDRLSSAYRTRAWVDLGASSERRIERKLGIGDLERKGGLAMNSSPEHYSGHGARQCAMWRQPNTAKKRPTDWHGFHGQTFAISTGPVFRAGADHFCRGGRADLADAAFAAVRSGIGQGAEFPHAHG